MQQRNACAAAWRPANLPHPPSSCCCMPTPPGVRVGEAATRCPPAAAAPAAAAGGGVSAAARPPPASISSCSCFSLCAVGRPGAGVGLMSRMAESLEGPRQHNIAIGGAG